MFEIKPLTLPGLGFLHRQNHQIRVICVWKRRQFATKWYITLCLFR